MCKIKKVLACFFAVILLGLTVCSCSAPKECEKDEFFKALKNEKEISACVYGKDDEYYKVTGTEKIAAMLKGTYEKKDKFHGGKKILTLTVSQQYEISFFDSGEAMIYYGFVGVLDKDRQYYNVKLDSEFDSLTKYIKNNGEISVEEE